MSGWPSLHYAAEKGVCETAHLYLQLIGKLPTRLHPWINHGWHVALKVTPRGFATRRVPTGARHFIVHLDVIDEVIRVECDAGDSMEVALKGQSLETLQSELCDALEALDLPAPLHGGPNEIPDAIPFKDDNAAREWNGAVVRKLHEAFASADRVFTRFRAAYRGKTSPSHLFWGSFDLAVTRFSGRKAPEHPGGFPGLPDEVTREAYSHEVISAGFWLGGGGVDEAAFYTYAYPSPDKLGEQRIAPDEAYWHGDLGEFVLPYAAVAKAEDPDAVLLEFLQSGYDAAAKLLDWPEGLALESASIGQPPTS